jgi:hypothetical protein
MATFMSKRLLVVFTDVHLARLRWLSERMGIRAAEVVRGVIFDFGVVQ